MNILQVSHNYHIVGGSDSVFFATSKMLKEAGHQVVPFCIDSPKNLHSHWSGYFPSGADTASKPIADGFQYFYNADARKNLNRLLDDVGPIDVAHLHIYHGKHTPAILPVLKARGIPIVQTLHEYKLACPVYTMQRNDQPCMLCVQGSNLNCIRHRCKGGSVLQSIVMAAEHRISRMFGDIRLIDRFLCVSNFQKKIMARAGIPDYKLFTLHNFAKTAGSAGLGHDGYFLYFGRIERLKGIPTMVTAFKKCGQRLIIAGDGDWGKDLRNSIVETPNIEYVGFQNGQKLRQLVSKAKAVVVPSEWNENCPMSVIEAKMLGRPVIGANIGGIPELIQHGKDGVLFEPGDVTNLVDAIGFLNRQDHGVMSRSARLDAENRFSGKVHLQSLLNHYSVLVAANSVVAAE